MERRSGVWLAVRGVAAILFGILALIWPGLTILALALLFGVYALIDGVGMLIDAFRGQRTGGMVRHWYRRLAATRDRPERRRIHRARAINLVGALVTALVLVIMVGAWAVVTGVLDIWAASVVRPGWLLVLVGVLSLLAGVLILIRPGIGAVALALVIGIYSIMAGVLMLVETWRLYRAPPQRTDRTAPVGI